MAERKLTRILLAVGEILFSLALLAWFVLPLFLAGGPLGLSPARLPWQAAGQFQAAPVQFILLALIAWSGPLLALWKLASPFLAARLPRLCDRRKPWPIAFNILASTSLLAVHLVHALSYAKGWSYLAALQPYQLAALGVGLAWNAFSIVRLIQYWGTRDENYALYREFRQKLREEGQRDQLSRWGIQKRLVVSFVAIIFVVIIALSGILLNDFSRTLIEAVNQSGKTLAERTASIIKTSIGDSIAVEDYLSIEAKKNKQNTLYPFDSLSFYKRVPGTNAFRAVSGTKPALLGARADGGAEAPKETTLREINGGRQIEFLSPITLSGVYIGYISAVYEKEIILEPFFRTQTKVLIIALVAIYFSIFITYLFGRNIVIPILFLRMSVNNISTSLGQMIRGDKRISAEGLHYADLVGTRDEIKGLSLEIGNMATVIRGVLPYISASTLKHSEKGQPSTEQRDLAFLFTDIRGFTTLCEGLAPDEVVTLLNHYLEIQSSVILANGGDIDKFVGDEIMAMFEGPDKELRAAQAAIGIAAAMAAERAKAEASKGRVINIGIGINSGPVVFGSVGARERMDFTSIGDTVNLAARLEGANKTYGTKTLIAETVYSSIKDNLLCREIDLMTVKGKKKPVRIYEIMGEARSLPKATAKLVDYFGQGLAAYRKQEWDKAEKIFAALVREYEDEPSLVFLQRVELFRKGSLPSDWDGVFNMTVK